MAAYAQSVAGLNFDETAFEIKTATVVLNGKSRDVTYRFYKQLPYVSRPVDLAYQTLNISVPVEIDGISVDASNAPVLFSIGVGGYMPSSTYENEEIDPPRSGPMGAPTLVEGAVEAPTYSNAMMAMGERVSNARLALASGYVVVEPSARGRGLVSEAGVNYGVAPAAIIDLKAALRYLHAFAEVLPGDMDHIFTSGTSAGGALSALVGASGGSPLYDPYLEALGAAEGDDTVFAVGSWCPIADLEHADMAYEWNWGGNPLADGRRVDGELSGKLSTGFPAYQQSLGLKSLSGSALTADTYPSEMIARYLEPSATEYLNALSDADRAAYLAENSAIGFEDGRAVFDWDGFLYHVGARKKNVPAFDALDLSTGENELFGTESVNARHFTEFGLRQATGDFSATLDEDIPAKLRLMNPMPFLLEGNAGRAKNWWIRVGAKDTDTALTVVGNLAAAAEGLGDAVSTKMYWDEGHGANTDAADFMDWIADLTGYVRPAL